MEAVAQIKFDPEYYEFMYSEWLKYRSCYRKVAVPIAILLIGVGLVVAAWLSSTALAIIVVIAGIFDIVESVTYRQRWLSKALDSKNGRQAKLTFTDSEVRIDSDNSNGCVRYDAFDSVVATPKSVFITPNAGASIFVPFSTVEPQCLVESLVATLLLKVNRGRKAN